MATRRSCAGAGLLLALALAVAVFLVAPASAESSGPACAQAGFNPDNLECSTCHRLERAIAGFAEDARAAQIVDTCKACCTGADDALQGDELFASADLVLDPGYLSHFPDLKTFIDTKAAAFSKVLKVKSRWGRRPELVLYDASGQPASSLAVEKWSVGELEGFLQSKLHS